VNDFRPGLEGVVAFQTEIAEPDKEGGSLRYRGVDIEELVGHYPYEKVWGLLVDESFEPGMPDPEPYRPAHLTGKAPSDLQSALAHLSAEWGLQKLVDIEPGEARDDLARLSAIAMSIVAHGFGSKPLYVSRRRLPSRSCTAQRSAPSLVQLGVFTHQRR